MTGAQHIQGGRLGHGSQQGVDTDQGPGDPAGAPGHLDLWGLSWSSFLFQRQSLGARGTQGDTHTKSPHAPHCPTARACPSLAAPGLSPRGPA